MIEIKEVTQDPELVEDEIQEDANETVVDLPEYDSALFELPDDEEDEEDEDGEAE